MPFLIDTGADICLIKKNILKPDTMVYKDMKCTLRGITSELFETFAECDATIYLPGSKELNLSFQIVEDSFPINCAGVIGQTFLNYFHCKIDYLLGVVEIPFPDELITLNIDSALTFESFETIDIPARTEKIMTLAINIPNGNEFIAFSQEIAPSIYMPSSIHKVQNNTITTSLLNVSDTHKRVTNFKFNVEPLNNFSIRYCQNWNDTL